MSRIGIIAALPAEAGSLQPGKYKQHSPVEIERDIFVCMSGMGAENAAVSVKKLIEKNVDAVISWGVAGSISPMLNPGDLLIVNEVSDQGSNFISPKRWVSDIALRLNSTSFSIHIGKISSVTTMCTTAKEKKYLSENTGAYAVDMESETIATLAKEYDIDFLGLRAVADDAEMSIPEVVSQHTDSLGRPVLLPFIFSCIKQPGQIKNLIKLAKCYNQALLTLRQVATDLKKQHFLYNS